MVKEMYGANGQLFAFTRTEFVRELMWVSENKYSENEIDKLVTDDLFNKEKGKIIPLWQKGYSSVSNLTENEKEIAKENLNDEYWRILNSLGLG